MECSNVCLLAKGIRSLQYLVTVGELEKGYSRVYYHMTDQQLTATTMSVGDEVHTSNKRS